MDTSTSVLGSRTRTMEDTTGTGTAVGGNTEALEMCGHGWHGMEMARHGHGMPKGMAWARTWKRPRREALEIASAVDLEVY